MKKAIVLVCLATVSMAGLAFGQKIRVVDGNPPETAKARGDAFQAAVMLQDSGRQSYREASLDESFFDGQRFRLRVTASQDGYLYVLCENSQKTAVMLYPNESSSSDNTVTRSRRVTIPDRAWFQFDEEPGTEHVYVILAANPIADLDRAAQNGGELPLDLLDEYAQLDNGRTKGIIRTQEGDIAVRHLDLRHESRPAWRRFPSRPDPDESPER